MKDSTIIYKVKVFLSSYCHGEGDRYTIVRKSIKSMLEESSITLVYAFEVAKGSSQDVVSSYLDKLEDSDLCVFLIDNKDNVSNAVLSEIKRARELKKKSIFFFCDQDKKKPTAIQSEIVESEREHFIIVPKFSDFTQLAYESVMQDIIDIYRKYCKPSTNDTNTKSDENPELKFLTSSSYILNKDLFSGFDKTKYELLNILQHRERDIKGTSYIDELCQSLFLFVSGKKQLPSNFYTELKSELLKKHVDNLFKFISIRIDAIEQYLKGNIKKCSENLSNAHDYAVSNPDDIPNWMINDVLIDKRNVLNLLLETQNKISFENDAQKELNKNIETVYYPLLDRIDGDFTEDALDLLIKNKTESPYTTTFGGIDVIFEKISSTFVISVLYGSLTQILIVRDRIAKTISAICTIYYNHPMYIELIIQHILTQNKKGLESLKTAYSFYQSTEEVNKNDLEKILSAINLVPIKHKYIISKLLFFKYYGYYLSDEQFTKNLDEILNEFSLWLKKNKRIYKLYDFYIDTIKSNIQRLDSNRIMPFIITVFSNQWFICYDKTIDILNYINFDEVSKDNKNSLLDCIFQIIKDEKIRNNCHRLNWAIISLRKRINIKQKTIDNIIKSNMQNFYENEYSLEIFASDDNEEPWKHIERYTASINMQNQEQGKGGVYHGYAGDPYETIRNIIEFDKLDLDWKKCEPIANAIKGTLLAERQSISAKYKAMKLLIYLYNRTQLSELNDTFKELTDNKDFVLRGHEDGLFEKESLRTLKNSYVILSLAFRECSLTDALEVFASLAQDSTYEIIKLLDVLETLLFNINITNINESIISILIQFVIGMTSHEVRDIRLIALRCLIPLTFSPFSNMALLQLSRMMDKEDYLIKLNILKNLKKANNDNPEIIKLIIQKGQVDNHYLVRTFADKLKKE